MTTEPGWQTSLEDGLVMRGAVAADADHFAEYSTRMHSDDDEPAIWIEQWVRDLLTKPHPSMSLDDVIIIEDTATGQVVSSCTYFQQAWSYCGIPVPFGRPELVSTHPDYRNRGLIRRQFDLMHRWGDERGHLVQGITGIPYYYRQFGYDMALDMGTDMITATALLPKWKEEDKRAVRLRAAERSDVPLLLELREKAATRALFSVHVTPEELEYQLFDRHEDSATARSPFIIEDASGTAIGSIVFTLVSELKKMDVISLDFTELPMFRSLTEPVLKCLREHIDGQSKKVRDSIERVFIALPEEHPARPFLGNQFLRRDLGYAWYVRTPDLPKLLMLIAPKLEERLVGTVFEGLTAEKALNFYRTGLNLKFEDGRLAAVEPLRFPERRGSAASLPDLTFLQLLFGRKSIGELADSMVDARADKEEDELLLDTLFPKMPSDTRFTIS